MQDDSGRSVRVDVIESTERFSELRLEDGTTLRIKPNVMKVARLVGQWDSDGNPIYVVGSRSLVLVSEAPAGLKKRNP